MESADSAKGEEPTAAAPPATPVDQLTEQEKGDWLNALWDRLRGYLNDELGFVGLSVRSARALADIPDDAIEEADLETAHYVAAA